MTLNTEAYALGKQIVTLIQKKKVVQVEVLDVHELTPLTDLFIIAIGNNVRQTQSLADDVEEMLDGLGYHSERKEGYRSANWILLDYGEVIVHILEKESAAFYGLDRLWKDAPIIAYSEVLNA